MVLWVIDNNILIPSNAPSFEMKAYVYI